MKLLKVSCCTRGAGDIFAAMWAVQAARDAGWRVEFYTFAGAAQDVARLFLPVVGKGSEAPLECAWRLVAVEPGMQQQRAPDDRQIIERRGGAQWSRKGGGGAERSPGGDERASVHGRRHACPAA